MTGTPFDPSAGDALAEWIAELVEDHGEDADAPAESWDVEPDTPAPDLLVDDEPWRVETHAGTDDVDLGHPPEGSTLDHDALPHGDAEDEAPTITLDDPAGDEAGEAGQAGDGADTDGASRMTALVDLAGGLGAEPVDTAALVDLLDRLGADESVYGVEGRTAVQVLTALGVDAHVAHGSVEELADRVDAGEQVAVTDDDGRRRPVVEVDFAQGRLVLDVDGERQAVGLADFAACWSDAAFELLVAEGDGPDGHEVQVLVPVSVQLGGI